MRRSLPSRLDLMRLDVRRKVELRQAEEREFEQEQTIAIRYYRQITVVDNWNH